MIRNSRRRASGSTGWRARPPSTGGTTSCSMSGKPQRRPRQRQVSKQAEGEGQDEEPTKVLGLTIPPSLLARADQVIDQ